MIGDKGQEVPIRRSNCTNGVVRSGGMRSAERRKVNVLEVFEKFCWSVANG